MPRNKKSRRVNFCFWQRHMAIDLGTTNTLIFIPRKGVVLQEPSVVALRDGAVIAAGEEAYRMLGRTPIGIKAERPIQGGVIANFDLTLKMLQYFINQVVRKHPMLKLRVIVTVPYGTTQVERRAVLTAGKRAGVKETYLIEEPIAAAIGSGLPVAEPRGSFVVNFGGGVIEIAAISLGGIVLAQSLRQGGETIDETIMRYINRRYRLDIGLSTAEEAKRLAGYATEPPPELTYVFRGINLYSRVPDTLEIKAQEITEAIEPVLSNLSTAIRQVFEQLPPQLASDVMNDGILLAGGGALLKNLDLYLSRQINLPVYVVEDPFTCVVRGASQALRYLDRLELQRG